MSLIGYEMRIAGTVPTFVLYELGDVRVIVEPASTVLIGNAVDESAQYGVPNRMHVAGLQLLEFRRPSTPLIDIAPTDVA
jgi:hypothetical protein